MIAEIQSDDVVWAGYLLYLGVVFGLPVVGIVAGIGIERRHIKSLDRREAELSGISVTDLKSAPAGGDWSEAAMVSGACVVASDYFKSLAAALRGFFGGEIKSLRVMQDRARREAIVRMLVDARARGASAVCNVRIETSTVGGKNQRKVAGVEVLAYGTALIPSR